ncbi:hypothetical protein DFH06DRAFT_1010815, partial [Mycena polygramma]
CGVEGCGKGFARGEHLKKHVRRIHTWEQPYECPYDGCGKTFGRRDTLAAFEGAFAWLGAGSRGFSYISSRLASSTTHDSRPTHHRDQAPSHPHAIHSSTDVHSSFTAHCPYIPVHSLLFHHQKRHKTAFY